MKVSDSESVIDRLDSNRFEELYRTHAKGMYGLALQLTHCEEQARDIVQQVFVGIWERKNLQVSSWQHYLLRATKLECIDHFRKKERQKTNSFAELEEMVASEKITENQVLANDLKNLIDELSDQLPPQCRRVFSLSREAGYSNQEIASHLQISIRAVEQHITKALLHFRKNLKYNQITIGLFLLSVFSADSGLFK